MKKRVICIGSGLAALNLALHLSNDIELFLVSPANEQTCNSYLAKGGIAVPLADEDIENHIEDTLNAGAGLCDVSVVKDLISSAPAMLKTLEAKGIVFENHLALEGGHNKPRVRHKADETGKYVTLHFGEQVRHSNNVLLLHTHHVIELLSDGSRCYGVLMVDINTGQQIEMTADAVVLASGGSGGLYLHHTNSAVANGEGLALASFIGAEIKDLEFIQFHPTMLYSNKNPVLITEAFRGAGAILTDENGFEFMKDVHPLGSLAPRDIISRTMFERMQNFGKKHLWLDFNRVAPEELSTHFPALRQLFSEMKLTENKVPVLPAAHYQCGGVCTNTLGETSVTNLYAIGEVARTGLHGANRLASNSLMELLIISERVAKKINQSESTTSLSIRTFESSKKQQIQSSSVELKQILWDSFGIIRNPPDMNKGLQRLVHLKQDLQNHKDDITRKVFLNRVEAARLIAVQAIARTESIGCHYVKDKQNTLIDKPMGVEEICS